MTKNETVSGAGALLSGVEGPSDDDKAALALVSQRLRELRRGRGMRLGEAAAIAGVSEPYLSRIEAGERWPSLPTLLSLARVYGVDASVLLGRPPVPDQVALHRATAVWEGGEQTGSGVMANAAAEVGFSLASRVSNSDTRKGGDGEQLGSPEELVGMALAGCFSMSLTQALSAAGYLPMRIETTAEVRLAARNRSYAISEIQLGCRAQVEQIPQARFDEIAQLTKRSCVVSRALSAVPVSLTAELIEQRS